MQSNIITTLLGAAAIISSCNSRTTKSQNAINANDSITAQVATTVKQDENLTTSKDIIAPQRVNAEFEEIHDALYGTFEDLTDSLVTQLRNTEISFCGDTIIINGIKSTYSRRTVATKNIFRQALLYQRFVFDYFGSKEINLNDSIDKLLVEYIYESDWNEKLLSEYKSPGIIYERPYLLIPYRGHYCASFIVDIEPSKFNRLLPERRDQRRK